VTQDNAGRVTRHASLVTHQPVGLLGGTFDPIHYGHLRLAEEMAALLGLDQVRILPAGNPPHRARPVASSQQRRAMVELAIAGNPRLRIDTSELDKAEPGYMVDTLAGLKRDLGPETPIVLILGADAFAGLNTWHQWRRLFDLCHFAVAFRPGYADWEGKLAAELDQEYRARRQEDAGMLATRVAGYIVIRPVTQLAISATRIRSDIHAGCSPRYLLPDPVLNHIKQHQLYK
jgi:nicotinate-nucleotide adenylyltransferase